MPLVRGRGGKAEWLKSALVLAIGMVAITAVWGVLVALAGAAFADFFRSSRNMGLIMQPVLLVMGALMLVIALGEFGLIRRMLPELHPASVAVQGIPGTGPWSYGRTALLGVAIAATFGIVCTLPPYLALLLNVAVVGSVAYGALALGAYGLGLATPILLGSVALGPAGRATRLMDWLAAKRDAIHVAQGILFAALGALVLVFFWVRYAVPPQ
ncbi:MAG TPA: cytochrome c biogenesis protein CcdA [Candidatus Limnocylindria bacterium]|jgi:cytochrome c biogenesis protein CcdA|nr:cytochrome c biogenesis protein CcdA [Candidatus Limnocylindria bacterium]